VGDGEETGGCTSPTARPKRPLGPPGNYGRESARSEGGGAAAGSGGSSSPDAPAAGGVGGVEAAGLSQGTLLVREWEGPRTSSGLGADYPATDNAGHPDLECRERRRSGVAWEEVGCTLQGTPPDDCPVPGAGVGADRVTED
jgi:hypothetical protein